MQNIILNFESLSEEIMSEYAGKWVAIIDQKVVVSGISFKEVYAKKEYTNEKPLVCKLPEASFTILSN